MIVRQPWRIDNHAYFSMPDTMILLSQTRRMLIWAVMALIVALLCILGVRGYLSTEMLLNFANLFYC